MSLTRGECEMALSELTFHATNDAIMNGDVFDDSHYEVLNQLIKEHFYNQTHKLVCEKCGKEIDKLKINIFDYGDTDSFYDIDYSLNHGSGCVSVITEKNWVGYGLSEEEMIETIVCPHCHEYPFENEVIELYEHLDVVMFNKEETK